MAPTPSGEPDLTGDEQRDDGAVSPSPETATAQKRRLPRAWRKGAGLPVIPAHRSGSRG